jgi:hypothetical protein
MFVMQMLKWVELFQKNKKKAGFLGKPCRQQFALIVALFDESENMYLSSGRAMRHVLLDADFDCKNTRSMLLRECVIVSAPPLFFFLFFVS